MSDLIIILTSVASMNIEEFQWHNEARRMARAVRHMNLQRLGQSYALSYECTSGPSVQRGSSIVNSLLRDSSLDS